jgi:hypothetical protein
MRRFAVFSSLFQASDYSLRTLDFLVQTSHLLSRQIGQALFLYEGLSLDGKVTPYLHFRKFSGRTQIWQDLACSSNFKDIMFLPSLHVTATAIVQAHLACMSNLVCATPQVHEQSEHVLVGVITGKL